MYLAPTVLYGSGQQQLCWAPMCLYRVWCCAAHPCACAVCGTAGQLTPRLHCPPAMYNSVKFADALTAAETPRPGLDPLRYLTNRPDFRLKRSGPKVGQAFVLHPECLRGQMKCTAPKKMLQQCIGKRFTHPAIALATDQGNKSWWQWEARQAIKLMFSSQKS